MIRQSQKNPTISQHLSQWPGKTTGATKRSRPTGCIARVKKAQSICKLHALSQQSMLSKNSNSHSPALPIMKMSAAFLVTFLLAFPLVGIATEQSEVIELKLVERIGDDDPPLGEFYWTSGIDVDSNGNFLISDTGNNRLQYCTQEGFCKAFGSLGTNAGEFQSPRGGVFDGTGGVIVADLVNHRIQVCSLQGACSTFGSRGTGPGQFTFPTHIEMLLDGTFLVADIYQIQRCDKEGECQILENPDSPYLTNDPTTIGSHPDGRVFIGSRVFDDRLVRVCSLEVVCTFMFVPNPGGVRTEVASITAVGADEILVTYTDHPAIYQCEIGDFSSCSLKDLRTTDSNPLPPIFDIDIMSDGTIVAASFVGDLIYICNPNEPCTTLGARARTRTGQFRDAEGIAYSSDLGLVVADTDNHRIQVCNPSCDTFGEFGAEVGQFSEPYSVAITSDNKIVVGDRGNGRIQICSRLGACEAFGRLTEDIPTGPGEFFGLQGVAVDDQDRILIGDVTAWTVQRCTQDGICEIVLPPTDTTNPQLNTTRNPRNVEFVSEFGVIVFENGSRTRICPDFESCYLTEIPYGDKAAISPSKTIVVAGNSTVWECELSGDCEQMVSQRPGEELYPGLNDVAFNDSGELFVVQSTQGQILKFDVTLFRNGFE